jgi:hypothetical protein
LYTNTNSQQDSIMSLRTLYHLSLRGAKRRGNLMGRHHRSSAHFPELVPGLLRDPSSLRLVKNTTIVTEHMRTSRTSRTEDRQAIHSCCTLNHPIDNIVATAPKRTDIENTASMLPLEDAGISSLRSNRHHISNVIPVNAAAPTTTDIISSLVYSTILVYPLSSWPASHPALSSLSICNYATPFWRLPTV